MQISRHWRMNANRYRLEGYAFPTGEKALQPRQTVKAPTAVKASDERKTQEQRQVAVA